MNGKNIGEGPRSTNLQPERHYFWGRGEKRLEMEAHVGKI